jgi:anaerobic selenocysteine-containing dehydrogenase
VQWHGRAVEPPGEAKTDREIMASLFMKLREMYAKDGGAFPDAIKALTWGYSNPTNPPPEEVLREINGKAMADVMSPPNPKDPKAVPTVLVKAGDQLPGFAMLRDDGSTACGNWIYCGVWSQAGNNSARRDTSDPSGLGIYQNWGFAWPANRRILYNRAGASPDGKPWDAKRRGMAWNGTAWAGVPTCPTCGPTPRPRQRRGPFIMNPEGVARLFARADERRPVPRALRALRDAGGHQPDVPDQPQGHQQPGRAVYKGDLEQFGKAEEFPYAATTYRLTEHFHYWTKHAKPMPSCSHRSSSRSARTWPRRKGIANGDRVKVRSNRGFIKAVAVVTKRIKGLDVDGKKVHTVGIPIHWGFKGVAKPASSPTR